MERGRTVVTLAVATVVLGMAVLIGRLWHIQVGRHEQYREIKLEQYASTLQVQLPRQTIFDAGGRALAVSRPVPSVYAQPDQIQDVEGTARALYEVLGLPVERIRESLTRAFTRNGRTHVRKFAWIKRKISDLEARLIRERRLKGVHVTTEYIRDYPLQKTACHILGFVNIDDRGQEGIEAWADRYLSRHAERVEVLVDGSRRIMAQEELDDGTSPRGDVYLTIDIEVQRVCEEELRRRYLEVQPRSAVLVAMNPKTGEILALVSLGEFDPNRPGEYPGDMRRNRVLTDPYEPGSAVKPFVIAGAIEAGKVKFDSRVTCRGTIRVGPRTVHEHDGRVHGSISMTDLISRSCNCGAVDVALRLGKEGTHRTLAAFGFGERCGVDLPGESRGRLYPLAQWTEAYTLGSVAIGHELLVTPLQLVCAMSAIANGGTLMRPYVVSEVVDDEGHVILKNFPRPVRRVLSKRTADDMVKMLLDTVERGTGTPAKVKDVKVAGKTGTTQKIDPATGRYSSAHHMASFVGFAPADDPEICIAVVVDDPQVDSHYGGAVAAPVVGRVLERTKHLFGSGHELSRIRHGETLK